MSLADEITRYVVSEYLPGTAPEELDPAYDLLDTGVVDSLRLLQLIAWLGERYRIPMDDLDISPEHFRSVAAMTAFVTAARDHAAIG
ncbi:acyl carrier protein [Micromonospora sp. R77]|uniref:acyl carrier protein n=1 Tax=Micromonospora sp. R77 TaxID=2925836 RepID=UPI001F5FFFED|nr:acyl carrier protein [Micromonospora sp. R77]MCI4061256.1 acyl carrier protein [Micromonospora sp. R77]